MRALAMTGIVLSVLLLSAARGSQPDPEPEVDRVVLAATLIGDGYWDRAGRVLEEVDEADPELDRARFHTLRGLVRAHLGDDGGAIEDFRAALTREGVDALVNLHLAQALLRSEQPAEALQALDDAGPKGRRVSGAWLLRARAHRELGDDQSAWVSLVRATAWHPDDLQIARTRVFLLVDLGLYQQALAEGRDLLLRDADDVDGWLALSEALRNAGERDEAIGLLEEARLRFSREARVHAQLARLYLETDRPRAAGSILQVGAELDPSLFEVAAESFRRAGDLERALFLNAWVPDADRKAKQRLGLYLESGDWPRAVALEDRLDRLGLLDEDALRYAMAYGWFQLGIVDKAEGWLEGISDPRWFKDATTLREAIAECQADGWGCP